MLHLDLADHYKSGSSRMHRLDARVKLSAALSFILIVSLINPLRLGSWFALALLFLSTLLISGFSGLGAGYALKRSYIALPFVLGALALPVTVRGTPLGELGGWVITFEGTMRLLGVFAKSWVSVQIAILLSVVTPFPDSFEYHLNAFDYGVPPHAGFSILVLPEDNSKSPNIKSNDSESLGFVLLPFT